MWLLTSPRTSYNPSQKRHAIISGMFYSLQACLSAQVPLSERGAEEGSMGGRADSFSAP